MSNTFTSKSSLQTKTTRERSVNRRVPPSQPTGTSSRNNRTGVRVPIRSSFNMNNQHQQPYQNQGHIDGFNSTPATSHSNDAAGTSRRLQSPQRTPSYAGSYTVIPPNESKRQQISQMAQRETQEYEQYKQATAIKHVSHVGTVGGGKITEEQVRKNQERALKSQKLDRLKRQEEQKNTKKKAEEAEIEKKRAAARKTAEQNAARDALIPPADEVRRNREAFLKRLENQSSATTAPIPSQEALNSQPLRQTAAQVPIRRPRPAVGSVYHTSAGKH